MTIRLGLTNDVDLAPLCYPWEAGWVTSPAGIKTETKSLAALEKALLEGELDIAPISPLTYVNNQANLRLLPTPVRAFDLAADSIFLISLKRLDQLERVRLAVSPNSSTGEAILKMIAPGYYGIQPESWPAPSEAAALESLQGQSEICVISGEAAMRSVGWAKAKGYFVEDLTKAWWIMTGLPLPIYLFGVRLDWTRRDPEAVEAARNLMVTFRRAIQVSQEQRPTLLDRAEKRTGLPAEALDNHFKAQRYVLNEEHLRGLLEFYRRANALHLAPPLDDLNFFPSLTPLAPTPPPPLRRSQPEAEKPRQPNSNRNRLQSVPDQDEDESVPNRARPTEKGRKPGSRRSEAQAKGLRVIKGGKDRSNQFESEEEPDE